jgi:ABC-type antimicrobial peptide transport system permease subunit
MKKARSIIIILGIVLGFYLLLGLISSYFGWYGYEKWKYRRETRGDIIESKERGVFVKNLEFEILSKKTEIEFIAFMEKGFKYGKHSAEKTELIGKESNFPYQVSFSQSDTLNKLNFELLQKTKLDSINKYFVYLKKTELNDTIYLKVTKWENKIGNDSIGIIKIYEKN